MLSGGNHRATPLVTHGFLLGIEVEEGTNLETIMNRLVDSVAWMDGVGQVEAEHIGELDLNKSLEEEVLDALTVQTELEVKES